MTELPAANATPVTYIITDGGCRGNGKKTCVASYAYIIINSVDLDGVETIRQMLISGNTADISDVNIDAYESAGLVNADTTTATNNRGELYGIVKALEVVDDEGITGDIVWISDSEYSQKSIDIWCRNWIKFPAKHSIETKANLDLILPTKDKIDKHRANGWSFKLVHVNSHQKMPDPRDKTAWMYWFLNDRVDKLSQTVL